MCADLTNSMHSSTQCPHTKVKTDILLLVGMGNMVYTFVVFGGFSIVYIVHSADECPIIIHNPDNALR